MCSALVSKACLPAVSGLEISAASGFTPLSQNECIYTIKIKGKNPDTIVSVNDRNQKASTDLH